MLRIFGVPTLLLSQLRGQVGHTTSLAEVAPQGLRLQKPPGEGFTFVPAPHRCQHRHCPYLAVSHHDHPDQHDVDVNAQGLIVINFIHLRGKKKQSRGQLKAFTAPKQAGACSTSPSLSSVLLRSASSSHQLPTPALCWKKNGLK